MASTAAAQQRKAVLLEARMRGLTGSEASSAFAPAQTTSLDPPVTEVGFRSPTTSREGVSTKPASGSSSMTGVLPPGAPAPREPSPLKRKAGDGMGPPPARRKSAQPRKLPTSKRASSDGGDERLSKAEAKASGLSQELERVREAASKEGEATRQKENESGQAWCWGGMTRHGKTYHGRTRRGMIRRDMMLTRRGQQRRGEGG